MTRDFQTGHFADLEQFKFDNHLLTLGKSKLIPLLYFNKIWAGDSYFNEFGQDVEPQKTIQTSMFDKKFKNPAWDMAELIFSDSISGNQELVPS